MVKKTMMWKVVLMMGMIVAALAPPVLGVLNNGFETDYVYYIDWENTTPTNTILIRSELDGSLVGTLFGPDYFDTLTFSGKGTDPEHLDYKARLFVAKPLGNPATDIAIAELNADGELVGSEVSLSTLLGQAQVGPSLQEPNIRYSSYHNSLFLGVNTNTGISTPAMVWEIDLGLTTVIHTYQGPNVPDGRVNIDTDPNGKLYVINPHMGGVTNQGDLIMFNTVGRTPGGTTVFDPVGNPDNHKILIDGSVYAPTDANYNNPTSVVYRQGYPARDDGSDTVVILTNYTPGWASGVEFYLDTVNHPPANGALAKRGDSIWLKRGWLGQQDEVTGDVWIATARGGYRALMKNDDTPLFLESALDLYDIDSPPYGGPLDPEIMIAPPDPDRVLPGPYARKLWLRQGNPPPTWSLVQGAPGAVINQKGEISGWTPTADDIGSTFPFQVDANNTSGTATATWDVEVVPEVTDIYSYEMDEDVGVIQPDGSPAMIKSGDGYGDIAAGDFNPPENAGYNKSGEGQDPTALFARFSDTGSNGNDGFYMRGLGQAPGASGFTIDMRAWGEEDTTGSTNRHGGALVNVNDAGRGIRIEPRDVANDSLRIVFVSSGPVATFLIDPTSDDVNPTLFHMIRFVLPNTESKILVYDLEKWIEPTGWFLVGEVTDIGMTHFVPGDPGSGGGFLLNSNSHGDTTNSKWSADWIRIDANKALGPLDPIIGGGEPPACNEPFADADEDGDVDQDDFALFQLCFTGTDGGIPSGSEYPYRCSCFNFGDDDANGTPDKDNDIDTFDFQAFQNCATGPGIQWSQELTPLCIPHMP